MRIPKVKRPIDNMSNEEIEQAKAELIKVCGPNIVNQIVDYSKGNNGRVEKLLKKSLLYISGITDKQSFVFDELPVYHFPAIINKTFIFNLYDLNLNVICTCSIYEKILYYIFEGSLEGGESHEYNLFKRYLRIEKSNTKITKLPNFEYQLDLLNDNDVPDFSFSETDSMENEYYNDQLDMDQQDIEFWDNI